MSELTSKQETFLEALTGEARGNIRDAMRAAGYSDNTRVNEVVGPLKEQIIERSSLLLAMNAPRATFSMVDVLIDPGALGARNAVSAAAQILDRAGIVKKEQLEVTGPDNGIFILPPKQSPPDETTETTE